MKKRFLLLLCALLALPVFASAEDVLMLSGAALNAPQTTASSSPKRSPTRKERPSPCCPTA